MSEIFILHLDNADEDLYTKILKVINESGHCLQRISAGSGMPPQFKDLKILPVQASGISKWQGSRFDGERI